MIKFAHNFITTLIVAYLFSSCNATKYVDESEYLLTKNTVYVNGKKNISDEVNDYVVQRPNQKLLNLTPFSLHVYNIGNKYYHDDFEQWKLSHPKTGKMLTKVFSKKTAKGYYNFRKGIHKWFLKNGEAPVVLDSKKTNQTIQNLTQHFYNEGYLNAFVASDLQKKSKKRIHVDYKVNTNEIFKINQFSTTIDSKVLDSVYQQHKEQSYLKKGVPFKLSYFREEQDRLTNIFRNSGVYRFNKNAITFEADTLKNKYRPDINFIIKDSVSGLPYKVQKVKSVKIHTNYLAEFSENKKQEEIDYKGVSFLSAGKIKYNPKYLLKGVFLEPNKIYKDEDVTLTRKNLRSFKNFKTVDIRFEEVENDDLEANIYLSPRKKYGIGLTTELTHSNIRKLGVSGKLSFENRNIFKGAEIFTFSIQGSFLESQNTQNSSGLLNAWELGTDLSLEIPRFLLPNKFNSLIPKSMSPKTAITLGNSTQQNIGLGSQRLTGIFDYTWESSPKKSHSFQLLNMQYIRNLDTNSYFNIYNSEYQNINNIAKDFFGFSNNLGINDVINFIDTNIGAGFESTNPEEYAVAQNVRNRYKILTEDFLIPSLAYTYTFNGSENYKDLDFAFFKGRFVSSGNLSSLLIDKKIGEETKTLFDTQIAQYLRADLELKRFWNVSNENVFAVKSFLGVAYPYGNSNAIPFNRSYFIGGPNDLRAWQIYDLGPGSSNTGLEFNVGNFKFLTSLEYRFKLYNSLKSAFFLDAGNIWDISNNEINTSETKFKGLNSIKEIAIGSGFGLRYDLSFILLRLDLGFKTYEPDISTSDKWFQNYNFANTVYNFGISYPF